MFPFHKDYQSWADPTLYGASEMPVESGAGAGKVEMIVGVSPPSPYGTGVGAMIQPVEEVLGVPYTSPGEVCAVVTFDVIQAAEVKEDSEAGSAMAAGGNQEPPVAVEWGY